MSAAHTRRARDLVAAYHARDRQLEADGATQAARTLYDVVSAAQADEDGFKPGDAWRALAAALDTYAAERVAAARAELEADADAIVRGRLDAAARMLQETAKRA